MRQISGALVLSLISFAYAQEPSPAAKATNQVSVAPTAGSEEKKECFQCKGTGQTKCSGASCQSGMKDCAGPCLKLSVGTWEKIPGEDPNKIFRKYPKPGGWQAWSQHHLGEVIEIQNGVPVNIGACKVCGGKGKVSCGTCQGKGMITCELCGGSKLVPVSWTAFNNPKLKNKPNALILKSGEIVIGKIVMRDETVVWVKTEDGKSRQINTEDLVTPLPPLKK